MATDAEKIAELEKTVAALQQICAALIDTTKYHMRGNDDFAWEKHRIANKVFMRMIGQPIPPA